MTGGIFYWLLNRNGDKTCQNMGISFYNIQILNIYLMKDNNRIFLCCCLLLKLHVIMTSYLFLEYEYF